MAGFHLPLAGMRSRAALSSRPLFRQKMSLCQKPLISSRNLGRKSQLGGVDGRDEPGHGG